MTGSQLGSPAFNHDTPILQAESLHATGAVILRKVKAYGEIRFTGAAIGRNLSLSEATLTHLSAVALTLDRAEIGGDLNLRRDFVADGEISLLGSKIHGNLDCRLATLNNPDNVALRADAATIAGSVLLGAGKFEKKTIATKFQAHGEVRLYRAVIGGYLDCTGAVFDRPNGAGPNAISLNAESATIRGPSFLGFPFSEREKPGWGFHAKGRVRFFDASLGSNFIGHAGLFENPAGVALDLERAHIAGSCLLRFRFKAQGQVSLVSTTIDDTLDFADADLSEADLLIRNTEIKRTLQIGAVAQPVQTSLDLTDTSCAVLTDDKNSWPVKGTLKLDGFAYRRLTHPGYSKDRLAWLGRQIPDTPNPDGADFHPQPYRQLASVLRAQGLEEEAKRVLIGMTKDSRKSAGPSRGSWLLFSTIRNGYQPLRAFKALVILWCIGCFVFGIAYQSGLICPSDKDAYQKLTSGYEPFCAPAYAIDSSLPIISFGQRDKWQPNRPSPGAAKPSGGDANAAVCELNFTKPLADSLPVLSVSTDVLLLKLFRWVYVAIGWFLTTMFVAGISGLAAKL